MTNKRNPAQSTTEGYQRQDGLMPHRTPELLSRNGSGSGFWSTPWWLYRWLDEMFGFTLDAAAHEGNHKHERYCSADPDDTNSLGDGLELGWAGETVFCQPPYDKLKSTKNQVGWAEKCKLEFDNDPYHTDIVMLIPARPNCRYFYKYLVDAEVYYFDCKMAFLSPVDNLPKRQNTAGSMLVVFSRDSWKMELAQFGAVHPTMHSISVEKIEEWWKLNSENYLEESDDNI